MDGGVKLLVEHRTGTGEQASQAPKLAQDQPYEFEERVGAYFASIAPRLRSAKRMRAVFEKIMLPQWGNLQLRQIRRRDVAMLVDELEQVRGPAAAQNALALLRAFFNWCAVRDETFVSPIVRGLARIRTAARSRVLSDDEIRALWVACSDAKPAVFGKVVKLLLLTGQRRNEISCARWDEINDEGELVIPSGRMKSKIEQRVPLTDAALAILDGVARNSDYIFSTRANVPLQGFGKAKRLLDQCMLARLRYDAGANGKDPTKIHLKRWTLHDLRRTARSLMSRAGVRPDHAERVLGHTISGVQGVYDRYRYDEEKAAALTSLAQLLERIVVGKADKKRTPRRRAIFAGFPN